MRPLFICVLTGTLLISAVNVAQAAPTTRLTPAPLSSDFAHSANVVKNTTHAEKTTLKQKAEGAAKKRAEKKAIHKAEKKALGSFKK